MESSLVHKWTRRLESNDVPDAHISVREIHKHVRELVSKGYEEKQTIFSEEARSLFEKLCMRRFDREPLQYILGEWDFRYITLHMRPPVFIPRPETEQLVEFAKKDIRLAHHMRVLEVGCGSGAISLSLLHENPDISCVAIDKLNEAVQLTRDNSRLVGVDDRIDVRCVDAEEATLQCLGGEKFDMLVSNPPYISTTDIAGLQTEVALHESHAALDGGEHGMDLILLILRKSMTWLNENASVWLEVDPSHPDLIETLVQDGEEFRDLKFVQTYEDYCERQRFCHLVYAPL